jgi:hypothetical protein
VFVCAGWAGLLVGGGGVAPGGVVGGADATLIRMTCADDGTLLKPTTPAMYIDRVWLGEAGLGEVATARTTLQGLHWAFTYRVCAESVGEFDTTSSNKSLLPTCNRSAVALTAADIGLYLGAPSSESEAGDGRGGSIEYLTYRWCGSRPAGRCTSAGLLPSPQKLSAANDSFWMMGGNLSPSSDGGNSGGAEAAQEADYWVAAPILSNGWTILGEAEALVPVSPQRLVSFDASTTGGGGGNATSVVTMVVVGSEGEAVTMLVADEQLVVYKVGPCVLQGSGRAEMVISSGGKAGKAVTQCLEL